MAHIWCPGCSCDVAGLLSEKMRAQHRDLKRREQRIQKVLLEFRSVVVAMERHAQAKSGELHPLSDIYRQWSDELLDEIHRRLEPFSKPASERTLDDK